MVGSSSIRRVQAGEDLVFLASLLGVDGLGDAGRRELDARGTSPGCCRRTGCCRWRRTAAWPARRCRPRSTFWVVRLLLALQGVDGAGLFSLFRHWRCRAAYRRSACRSMIFIRLSLPTNGSAMVLNTRAEKGWSSAQMRSTSSSFFGFTPVRDDAGRRGHQVDDVVQKLGQTNAGDAGAAHHGHDRAILDALAQAVHASSSKESSPSSKILLHQLVFSARGRFHRWLRARIQPRRPRTAGMSISFRVLPSPDDRPYSHSTHTTPVNLPFSTIGTSMGAMWLAVFIR